MKRKLKFVVPILLMLMIIVFIGSFFIRPINLGFAKTITLNYEYGEKNIHLEIKDKNDMASLRKLCKGTAINDSSIPACGFGAVELVFEGNGKKIVLYPAGDDCDTMRYGKGNMFFYSIGEANRKTLVKILEKYGVVFPCV